MEIEQNLIEQDMTMVDDVRSMKEIIKMANSICPTLQFAGDCPGANTNNKLPISRYELLGRRQLCTIRTLHKANGIKSSNTTTQCSITES